MQSNEATPHYGGQIGLIALLSMLTVTGCVAFTNQNGAFGFLPALPQASFQQPQMSVSQAHLVSAHEATFIVRFNDEPELQQVCRNFRRDEAGTRQAYRDWASNHPQLKDLFLVRASYSGELILALPANDPAGRNARDVIAALQSMDNIAYAEIDSMASANEGK